MGELIRFDFVRRERLDPIGSALTEPETTEPVGYDHNAPRATALSEREWVGANFDSDRDVKVIAKLVRRDIKAAIKAGTLPKGLKCSVKIDRYSMGCSLDVGVKSTPFAVHNVAWLDWGINPETKHRGYPTLRDLPRYTTEAVRVRDELMAIVKSYQRDRSDSMTDYYDVNFAPGVNFIGDIYRNELAARIDKGLVAL